MNPNTLAAAVGTATAAGTIAVASKLSGKPIGCKGSIAHIATNDKMDAQDKAKTYTQIAGQQLKDTVTIAGVTSVAGGTAAIAAQSSNKFVENLKSIKNNIADSLSQVSIGGKNLKETISNSDLYKKIKSLPTPAKAAIMVGAATFGVLAPLFSLKAAGDAGYIEGKNEKETIKV